MAKTEITPMQKATYIIRLIKSVGKDLNYAIDTAAWYTMTDKEQLQIEKLIKELW